MKLIEPIRRMLLGGLAGAVAVGLVCVPRPAHAQAQIPTFYRDSDFVSNRYLRIYEYATGPNVTKFDVWNEIGDPETTRDDLANYGQLLFPFLNPAPTAPLLGSPYGPRILSAPHPPFGTPNPDTSPYANLVTVRIVDPNAMGGITDVAYPGGGAAVFGPPTPTLPLQQGFFAPYRFQNGTIEINQKIQFARDLVRIEFIVRNLPLPGASARRVGIRLLLDSFVEYQAAFTRNVFTRSVFLPDRRERVFFETDYGQRTGTNTSPTEGRIPTEWQHFDDDEGPNPLFITKGYLTETGLTSEVRYGATTPTRFGIVNTLNVFPQVGQWDYPTDFHQELRISDQGFLLYWDPVDVPVGRAVSFVTYAGVGVADHGMSRFYLNGQLDSLNSVDPTIQNRTQGFIGAVQTPFALPLENGNADLTQAGTPNVVNLRAYLQNQYHDANIPNILNASAQVVLPEGLALSPSSQTNPIQFGNIPRLGSADEGVGTLTIQPTGTEAGLLPIRVVFNDGFGDTATAIRRINVPQGRLYQFGDDFRMVTFPFTFTGGQDAAAAALGLSQDSFRILRWNPQILDYEEVTRIVPGESYWIRLLGQGDTFTRLTDVARPVRVGQGTTALVQLHQGWNQVGNPYPYTVPLREVQFLISGNNFVTYADARARNLVRFGVHLYNRRTGQYSDALTQEDLIPPGQGIWIFANGEQTMVWPAPQGPQLSITP